jgi:TRAP-type C4-dicarboxylate transport system permease small subunit
MSPTEHPGTAVAADSASPTRGFLRAVHIGEDFIAAAALAAMVVLPLVEIAVRPFLAGGIPGSIPFVEHLTLWVGFLGASLAAREGKLSALATATIMPEGRLRYRRLYDPCRRRGQRCGG